MNNPYTIRPMNRQEKNTAHVSAVRRRRLLHLLALLSCCLFLSCETDNYESGDGKFSNVRADFAEVHTNHNGQLYGFMTDDGDSLTFASPATYKWATTADSTYRAIVYYNKVEGKADVISVSTVSVPAIIPMWKVKEMKTDPVRLESSWLSRNRRYANLGVNLLTGTEEGKDERQVLGMFCDTLLVHDNGHKHLQLRLYHDQNGVPQYYTSRGFVSIPLQKHPYRLGTGDTLSVTVNTYDGPVVKTFIY